MSEQIDIDGVKFKIGYDSKAVADGLKGDEKKAEESGKKAGQSWGNAFGAVAGAIAGAKIVGFFRTAVNESAKLENALLKVSSTARAMGQSIQNATAAAESLASDGFMSVTQSAQALSNLMQTGLSLDQAKKFVTASKDITAFGNTIGDAAQATEDLTLGLLRGSALVIDNASPALKSLSREYEKVLQTQGKTAAATFAYNKILKESEKFAGDAARSMDTMTGAQKRFEAATGSASAEIGRSLQPALKSIYNAITAIIESFTSWFTGLNETTRTILVLGAGLATLVPVLGSIGAALSLISLNPLVLGVTAAIVAFTALAGIISQFGQGSFSKLEKNYKDTRAEAEKLGETAERLSRTHKRTAQEELTLIDTKEKLRQKAKALGLDYDNLAKSAKSYLDISKAFDEKEKLNATADLSDRLSKRIATFNRTESNLSVMQRQLDAARGMGNTAVAGQLERQILGQRAWLDKEREAIRADNERINKFGKDDIESKLNAGGGGGGGKLNQVRFIEAQERLKEIEKARRDTERAARNDRSISNDERRRRIDAAKENAKILAETEDPGQLRQVYAEYIEDKYQADLEGLKNQEREAIASVRRQAEAGAIEQGKAQEKIDKIKAKSIQKEAALAARSISETLQAANATASGIAQIRTGNIGGGIGAALQGVAGFDKENSMLQTAGFIGQGLSAIVGIGNAVSGFFGKSAEELQRIATEQKLRDEEALKILELQANYQKNMLALQEAAAKLPFEDLQRQMRLADIEAQQRKLSGEDAAVVDADTTRTKLALAQGTLTSQSGKIGEGIVFGGAGSSPDELIAFLSQRAAQSTAIGQFLQLLDVVGSNTLSPAQYAEVNAQLRSYKGKIPDELYNAARGTVINFDGTTSLQPENSLGYGGSRTEYADGIAITTIKGSAEKINAARRVASEISADTGIAENLLSVIEQSNTLQLEISANTKKTAENTAKALELRPDRERSFIDVGQGYIQSLGQRISGMSVARRLGEQNFQLPSGIGSASGVATAARTVQELTADLLSMNAQQNDTMIDILQDVRAGIIELVAVLDANPNTVSGMSVSEFTRIQSEINRRRR